MDKITDEKLDKYFKITEQALEKAKAAPENLDLDKAREDILGLVKNYIDDAKHFKEKNDFVNALACITYAHGLLDAGARIGLFEVHDSKLFITD